MRAAEFHTLHFSFAWRSFGRRLATAFDPSVCVSWKNSTPTVLDKSSSSYRLFLLFTSPFFSLSIWSFQLSTARSLVLKRNSKGFQNQSFQKIQVAWLKHSVEKLVVLWNLDQLLLGEKCWIWKTVWTMWNVFFLLFVHHIFIPNMCFKFTRDRVVKHAECGPTARQSIAMWAKACAQTPFRIKIPLPNYQIH